MRKNIGYHPRLDSDNRVKVVGGSFGGTIDMETVERLVKAHFTVIVKPSGRPVFVDKQGREVSLYISVDPAGTEAGRVALLDYWAERNRLEEAEREERAELMARIEDMDTDALRKLLGDAKEN